jgi:hypothetical protein
LRASTCSLVLLRSNSVHGIKFQAPAFRFERFRFPAYALFTPGLKQQKRLVRGMSAKVVFYCIIDTV